MLFNRKKNREASTITDVQRLKREIRAELARIHGGAYEEPQPALAAGIEHEQPALQHDPGPPAPEPRLHSVTASPLIQKAALGQIAAGSARAANGRHDDDSPFGAFRHLIERFEAAAARLEAQIDRTERMGLRASVAAPEPARVAEPRFQADGPPVQVALVGVPNFQALMDLQRALSSLDATGEATVSEFEQGDASLQLSLRESMSLSEIMEGLRDSSGHALLVEESRPEAARLRLRFIPEPRSDILNPERWAKA